MPGEHDLPERRRALRDEAARLAEDLTRAMLEARAVNLPVEPGVGAAREALARWAALLDELLPPR